MSNHVDLGFECLSATKLALIFASIIFFARFVIILCCYTREFQINRLNQFANQN